MEVALLVVRGNDYCKIIFFLTICIIQFPCNLFYVGLSSLYLNVANNAYKYHKLQSSANFFPKWDS